MRRIRQTKRFCAKNKCLRALFLVLVAGLGTTLLGCAAEQPGVSLEAGLLLEGQTGENDEVKCELIEDPESAARHLWRGELDISQLEQSAQFGPPEGINFNVFIGMVNSLEPASGEGGGLRTESNDVEIERVKLSLPKSKNNFPKNGQLSQLEVERKFSIKIDPGGGTAVTNVALFEGRQLQTLKDVYRAIVTADQGSYDPSAVVPLRFEIQGLGQTVDGTDIKTTKASFPVEVCGDCDDLGVSPTCFLKEG